MDFRLPPKNPLTLVMGSVKSVLKWEIYELERQDYSGDRPVYKICGDSDNLYYLKKDGIIAKDSFYLCQSCLDGIGIMQNKLYE